MHWLFCLSNQNVTYNELDVKQTLDLEVSPDLEVFIPKSNAWPMLQSTPSACWEHLPSRWF